MPTCDALYYPFSRCMGDRVLKQYLLLFDSITFLDPVDDDGWRRQLFEDIEYEDAKYASYRDLADAMPWLRQQGVIKVRSPDTLRSLDHEITVRATLTDLADMDWVKAADPRPYHLPVQSFGGEPSWNVFRPKIPEGVVAALYEQPELRGHLLQDGGEHYAWFLSYAAGSSIGINVHLAAAEELSLAPVTDSRLHHHLMLRKLQRGGAASMTPAAYDDLADAVASRAVFNVLEKVLPPASLDSLSLQDIMHFRQRTEGLRREFLQDVARLVASEIDPESPLGNERAVAKVTEDLVLRARVYGAELASVRDMTWTKIAEVALSPTNAAGVIVGLAASFITGSGYVLCASALIPAVTAAKAYAEWKAADVKVKSANPGPLAYLSQVGMLS